MSVLAVVLTLISLMLAYRIHRTGKDGAWNR